MRLLSLVLLLSLGCRFTSEIDGPDADGDHYGVTNDCDDADAVVHPGQTEIPYNGVDDDCDPSTLDDDLDGDGWSIDEDCDDLDPRTAPSMPERCDGRDNDCDALVDETLGGAWYADADADGWGDPGTEAMSCDGSGEAVARGGDCDDGDASVNPGATEQCDAIDHDCDGELDHNVPSAAIWYVDLDADGFGDDATRITACAPPPGMVARGGDCDDAAAETYPGADERCDGLDNDCDLGVDESPTDASTFHLDHDGDGYGDATITLIACTMPPDYVVDATDCDDTDGLTYPNAPEWCTGTSNDCDAEIDESPVDGLAFYPDLDGDGFGDGAATALIACSAPLDMVPNADDCDDEAVEGGLSAPDLVETCDGHDNDCNGTVDDSFAGAVWFEDVDGDGYAGATSWVWACEQPAGFHDAVSDCDDSPGGGAVNPDATETCDGTDEDCDGLVDEDVGSLVFYLDGDGDGWGDNTVSLTACAAPSSTWVSLEGDCDDTDAAFFPGAAEPACGDTDYSCDGAVPGDSDGDGFIAEACGGADCADTDGDAYPGTGCSAGVSCLDAFDTFGFDTDGWYDLDPDQTGLVAYFCDMTEDTDRPWAGWTLLYDEDFQTGGSEIGWDFTEGVTWTTSAAQTSGCGTLGSILGGYNRTSAGYLTRDIDATLFPHEHVHVDLSYLFIDSWDTETAYTRVAGRTRWIRTYHYSEGTSGAVCGSSSWGEHLERVSTTTYEPSDVFNVQAGSSLSEGAGNESFGIDDITVWVR